MIGARDTKQDTVFGLMVLIFESGKKKVNKKETDFRANNITRSIDDYFIMIRSILQRT